MIFGICVRIIGIEILLKECITVQSLVLALGKMSLDCMMCPVLLHFCVIPVDITGKPLKDVDLENTKDTYAPFNAPCTSFKIRLLLRHNLLDVL